MSSVILLYKTATVGLMSRECSARTFMKSLDSEDAVGLLLFDEPR